MKIELFPWLAAMLILAGSLLCLMGAIGVLRLPDAYTRMHAASKAGALGAVLILAGAAAASSGEAALEAMLALLVILATAPLAAHVVARAAYRAGVKPDLGHLGDVLNPGTNHTAPASTVSDAEAVAADETRSRQTGQD